MDEIKPIETLKEAYWWLNLKVASMIKPPLYELLQQVSEAQQKKEQPAAIQACQSFCSEERHMPEDLKKLVEELIGTLQVWDPKTDNNLNKVEQAMASLREYRASYLQSTYPYILSLRKAVIRNPDEAWNTIERLGAISHKITEQLEAGETLVECAWAAYRLKNNHRAIELLEDANRFYNTFNHQKAVVDWMIGCLYWISHQPDKAHLAWISSANIFGKLSNQRLAPPGVSATYYQELLSKLQATLEFVVIHEGQPANDAGIPKKEKTTPPTEDAHDKAPGKSSESKGKAKPTTPAPAEDEWVVSYAGDLIETFPVVSKVPAGRWKPTLDDPNMIGKVEIGPVWIDNKPYVTKNLGDKYTANLGVNLEKHVVIKISGDSMNNAKPFPIENDDYILLRLQDDADSGDIVAAKIYDEATRSPLTTIKRLSKRGTRVILKPESTQTTYPDLEGDIQIVGLALAVFKPARKQ